MSFLLTLIERRHLVVCFGTAFFNFFCHSKGTELQAWLYYWPQSAVGLRVRFSLWTASAEPLREERCEAGVAFVSPHTDSLHQRLQQLIEVFQQVIMKNVKLVVLALFLCSPTRPTGREPGSTDQAGTAPWSSWAGASVGQRPDLTFSTEVASKAMIFVRIQKETRVLDANPSAMLTSHSCDTTRLLPPTQLSAKPTPDINNLTGKTFLN